MEKDVKPLVGKLVLERLGVEAILEVVVLGGGVVLNGTEATMVVSKHQTIVGHHNARAEAAQLNNGVVQ